MIGICSLHFSVGIVLLNKIMHLYTNCVFTLAPSTGEFMNYFPSSPKKKKMASILQRFESETNCDRPVYRCQIAQYTLFLFYFLMFYTKKISQNFLFFLTCVFQLLEMATELCSQSKKKKESSTNIENSFDFNSDSYPSITNIADSNSPRYVSIRNIFRQPLRKVFSPFVNFRIKNFSAQTNCGFELDLLSFVLLEKRIYTFFKKHFVSHPSVVFLRMRYSTDGMATNW